MLRCSFGVLSKTEKRKLFKIEQQKFPVLTVLAFVHSDVGCAAPSYLAGDLIVSKCTRFKG